MKSKALSFIISCFLLSLTSCEVNCNDNTYDWRLPFSVSPMKDTLLVGDTIHVVSEFGKVWDRGNQRHYELEDYDFFPIMEITDIGDTLEQNPADQFDLIPTAHAGGWLVENGLYVLRYSYDDDLYRLAYLVVMKDTGRFLLSNGSQLLSNHRGRQEFDGKCRRVGATAHGALAHPDSANIQMLEDSPDPHYHDWVLQKPQQRFHEFAGFAFYVKPR
ncbi:MAG: hypothetical protein RI842_09885 [Schleiferiaceae bacterium]|nr:hypothetical protein [Schleiferiaceae bacterium]MDR9443018.1 hypothetical protein [Schleiferiaceae bacterium]